MARGPALSRQSKRSRSTVEFQPLPGWKITGVTETAKGLLVRAELLTDPAMCCHCKASPELLLNHGMTMLSVKDIPQINQQVQISLTRRRYLCSACGGTTLQPITGIAEGFRLTDRLITLAAQRAFRTPLDMVAAELGLTECLVRAVVSEEVDRLERVASYDAPRILNVRLTYLDEREKLLMADAEAHRVIGIAAGADAEVAIRAISKLRDPGRVEIVTLPMVRYLWSAVREVLPQAKVSVDRFLVMSLGSDALDAVRERVHSCSPGPKREKALLAAARVLRSRFIDVFRTESGLTARRRYSEWAAGLPEELGFAFCPLVRMVEDWNEEIFCYFDHHFAQDEPAAIGRSTRPTLRRTDSQKKCADKARGITAE